MVFHLRPFTPGRLRPFRRFDPFCESCADVVVLTVFTRTCLESLSAVEDPSRLFAEMLFVLGMPLLAKRWRRRGDDGEEMLFVLK